MATFTFGSVGDIIAICQVVQATVGALDGARGSAADYQALGRSLSSLAQVLSKIKALTESKKDVVNMAGLDQTLRDCLKCLNDFYSIIQKYSRALGARGQPHMFKDVLRKIQWLSEKEDVSKFHRDIVTYLSMLQLLIQLAGLEVNTAEQAALRGIMSETDNHVQKGFLETHTLLEKIVTAIELRGEGSVSNAAVGAATTIERISRKATLLAETYGISQGVSEAYQDAASTGRRHTKMAIRDFYRLNKLFADEDFDVDYDLRTGRKDCLVSLDGSGSELNPGCVRRIYEIFDNPRTSITEATVVSLEGYEYFKTVLTALQSRPHLINRILVERDEEVGVYCFVFFRDGRWFHSIVDDRLYLEKPEYSRGEAYAFTTSKGRTSEEQYKQLVLKGSEALYFAASSDENATVIPLLEKAYARAHGDYGAIQNLYIGDALEDFTGGVTIDIDLSNVLQSERLWKTALLRTDDPDGDPIVLASNRRLEPSNRSTMNDDGTLVAVLDAAEVDGFRLLKLLSSRPGFWYGAWSDGSEEWTVERMQKLNHKFRGDNTISWMTYSDFARNFNFAAIHHIFSSEWRASLLWAAFEVPWAKDELQDAFQVTITADPPGTGAETVFVLSQLDTTYFRGLEGLYDFELDLAVYHEGEQLVRAGRRFATQRSNTISLDLINGTYIVRPRVTARKMGRARSLNNIILATSQTRQEKLLKMAYGYDLAHAEVAGWRAVNEMVQERRLQRIEARRAVGQNFPDNRISTEGPQGTESPEVVPPTLRADDVLGYYDWDAVAALGLRVLVKNGEARIELKRHGNEKNPIGT